MPRPGLLEPSEINLPRPAIPEFVELQLESECEVAETAFKSVGSSELNLASLLEGLDVMNGQLQRLTHGQSRLQFKVDNVQRGLSSVLEAVGRSPVCEAKCKSAHAQEAPMATDCNAEDPACMDITPGGKAGNRGHKTPVDMPRRKDPNKGKRDLHGEAGMHSTPSAQSVPELVTPKSQQMVKSTSKGHISCLGAMIEHELEAILLTNIQVQRKSQDQSERMIKRLGTSLGSNAKLRMCLGKLNGGENELLFDCAVGLVIILNAVFIGVSLDAADQKATSLMAIELVFSIIFWLELIVKMCLHGWREQYCGKESCQNIFDTCLVVADTLQFLMQLFFSSHGEALANQGISASLFRVVRLMRLARILRVLQLTVFKDLLTMMQGMLGGMSTLCWSMVLFVIFIYVVALLCRESLGPNPNREYHEDIEHQFQTVPRSMFTMFRCSFGDCSTSDGTPLFELVTKVHGTLWSLLYACFVFVVVIGLFNVISAIFVENTLASASELAADKRRELLEDPVRWATSVFELLRALCANHSDLPDLIKLEESAVTHNLLHDILRIEFPGDHVKWVVRNDEVAERALHRLDIDPNDHAFLADILDPQNDGSITVMELVNGLKRLRGEPRRSDIITIDLMVRSLQERIDEIWYHVTTDFAGKHSRWSETLNT